MTRIHGRADIVQHFKTQKTAKSASKIKSRLRRAFSVAPGEDATTSHAKPPNEDVCLWEIKFVAHLSLEHVVQASTYAYLWAVKHKTEVLPRILLFNIRSGEKLEIRAKGGRAGLQHLIEDVLRAKYSTGGEVSTSKFLKLCARTREGVEAFWLSQTGELSQATG
jgi:hypothetical protein